MTTPTQDSQLITTSAVDPEIAAAIRIHDRLVPVKDALGISDLTDQEVSLFSMVAQRLRLDPFAKQIYAIKRAGKVSYQTGIDGYRSVAAQTKEYGGSDEATYEECPCGQAPKPHPSVARVLVHRIRKDGARFSQVGIARWHELKPEPGANKADARWIQMPYNQLAKCAEANGLRKAFPTVLADLYITEEMDQAGPPENPRLVEAAGQPKAVDRIAARRAAVEAQAATVEVLDQDGEPIDSDVDEPDTDSQGEAAAAPEPASGADVATVASPASGADPEGYRAFAVRLNSTAAAARPSRAQILVKANAMHKDIKTLGLTEMPDWPFLPGAWAALADALALAKVSE